MKDSPDILALHGFTGCGGDFNPLAKLCGGNWHCPDLPGHGPKPMLDCRPTSVVEFVRHQASLIWPRSSRTPRILLGYSMGARAALLHATKYPDFWDALILVSANPGIADEAGRAARRSSDEVLARLIEREGVPTFLDFWQQQPLIRSQARLHSDWLEVMRRNRLRHTTAGLAASLRLFGQGTCPNLWPELHTLTPPVLLIAGKQDSKYRSLAVRMVKILTHAQSLIVPHAGHMTHLEAPEACAEGIDVFLAQVTPD